MVNQSKFQKSIALFPVLGLFLALSAIVSNAMDFEGQREPTEKTKLFNSQESDQQYLEIQESSTNNVMGSFQVPLFPGDVWKKIIYQWVPKSKTDKELTWSINDICSLSLTCKELNSILRFLETYSIVRDLVFFRSELNEFLGRKEKLTEEENIAGMRIIKTKGNTIEDRYIKQAQMLKSHVDKLDNLSELQILFKFKPIREAINLTLSPNVKAALSYAEINHEILTPGDTIIDLGELSKISGEALPPYLCDFRRDYKRIFQKKYLMVGGTLILGIAFICKGMEIYNQYPQMEAQRAGDEAFAALLNQTGYDFPSQYWAYNWDPVDCYEKYWFSHSGWGMWWDKVNWNVGGGPGYCYFPSMNSHVICSPGNMTEWMQQVADKGGFNATYWLEQACSILNGTKHPRIESTFCFPNTDGVSVSCGSAYNSESQNDWNTNGLITLQLTRGDALCARDIAQNRVIGAWETTMGLYWGVGSVGSLFFVYLWLIHFWC